MLIARAWNGIEAALFDTPAGRTETRASSRHRLAFHAGRPVRAMCRFAGLSQRRVQSRGDVDVVPAGNAGTWEDDRATRILRIQLSNELLCSVAGDDRVELAAQLQLRDPRLEHLAWALEAELMSDSPEASLYGESVGVALAVHLVRHHVSTVRTPRPMRGGLSLRQLRLVTEHVDANLERTLSLAELAAVAGLGVSQLTLLWRRSVGVSAHRWILERRVERAEALLREDTASISEIAQRTGFSDASHLARWMRRLLGVTPALVRRRH